MFYVACSSHYDAAITYRDFMQMDGLMMTDNVTPIFRYAVGQGYRYQGKIVQVAEIKDGKPVFKTLTGEEVKVQGGVALRAIAYDKLDKGI